MKRETKETVGALTIAAVMGIAGVVCDPLSGFQVDPGAGYYSVVVLGGDHHRDADPELWAGVQAGKAGAR